MAKVKLYLPGDKEVIPCRWADEYDLWEFSSDDIIEMLTDAEMDNEPRVNILTKVINKSEFDGDIMKLALAVIKQVVPLYETGSIEHGILKMAQKIIKDDQNPW